MSGPLTGIRVIELQGHGPGPYAAMLLADLGAEVIRVARVSDVDVKGQRSLDLTLRGRRSVAVDLKHPDGVAAVLRLAERADVLMEGFRPGVLERLGLGPDVALARNPRLVYARITGWGREGSYASTPGHDINYVALSGALDSLRRPGQPPTPPLNLLGDYGGGGMLAVIGVLGALVERSLSGRGQVVDASMLDGVNLLTTWFHGARAEGLWSDVTGSNVLDGGAPFYQVYETADGRYVSVGSGEPQFYAELLDRIGLGAEKAELLRSQSDQSTWPGVKAKLAAVFKTRPLAEWTELLDGTNTCFAPVLTWDEAPKHAHNAEHGTFITVDEVVQPAPAPRFSRTPAGTPSLPDQAGGHTTEVLLDWGFSPDEVSALLDAGALAQPGAGPTKLSFRW